MGVLSGMAVVADVLGERSVRFSAVGHTIGTLQRAQSFAVMRGTEIVAAARQIPLRCGKSFSSWKEAAMLVRDRKSVDRSARTIVDRGSESAPKTNRAGGGWRGQGERRFHRPAIDQDSQTIVLLFIIAVLSALTFMLRFPELGAVIAPLNQF